VLNISKPTTLVACSQCGRDWPPQHLVAGLCEDCAARWIGAQALVAASIEARGYREGWDPQEFAARQCCKLMEELAELLKAVCDKGPTSYHVWAFFLSEGGRLARGAFDGPRELWWKDDQVQVDAPQAMKELADLQVVVFCLAQVLGELAGQPFDIVRAAIEKAETDVGRGVRGQIEGETHEVLDK